jgi:3-hydroxyisobutyrate dehydrogenase
MTTTKVAFLGLGIMGNGMARRLAGAGFDVCVYNRNPARSAAFAGVARIANSPAEAAEGADVIISMVADDTASRSLWLGDKGALSVAQPGAICIESSTISLDWIKDWVAAAAEKNCVCLDAPVTGSKTAAEEGQLAFIVGGDAGDIDRARPVLTAMSKGVTHMGPVGSGALFKLINNFVCGVQLASLAEAIAMIDQSSLNREQAIETLANASPGSPLVKLVAPRMMKGDYAPNFIVRLMAKDLTYAVAEAGKMGLDLKTGRTALAEFAATAEAGFGDDDIAAIYKYIKGETA